MTAIKLLGRSLDGGAWVLIALLCLVMTYPWIHDPINTSIGIQMQPGGLVSPDIAMNVSFHEWFVFAPLELREWPLARSEYRMFPGGAAYGRSFDGLMFALVYCFWRLLFPMWTAYNLSLLIAPLFSGGIVYQLGHYLWRDRRIALTLGLAASALGWYVHRLTTHPNLVYVWAVPLSYLLFLKFTRKPTWKRALTWSLSFPIAMLCSWYILVITLIMQTIFVVFYLIEVIRKESRLELRRRVLKMSTSFALGLLAIILIGYPMIFAIGDRAKFDVNEMQKYSSVLIQHILPNPGSPIGKIKFFEELTAKVATPWEGLVCTPVGCILLALAFFCRRGRKGRRLAESRWPWITLVATGMVLSLGPFLNVFSFDLEHRLRTPLHYLADLPLVTTLFRVPGRMGLLVTFGGIIASGYTLKAILDWTRRRSGMHRALFDTGLCLLVAVNLAWCLHFGRNPVFQNPDVPAAYSILRNTPGVAAVLDIPFSYYWSPHYNLDQFAHGRPVVSSVAFHDGLDWQAHKFIWQEPRLRSFMDYSAEFRTPENLEQVQSPAFKQFLLSNEIQFVIFHKDIFSWFFESKFVEEEAANYFELALKDWHDWMIYEDDTMIIFDLVSHPIGDSPRPPHQ